MSKEELQKRLNDALAKLDDLGNCFYCDTAGFQTYVLDRLPRLKAIFKDDKKALTTLAKFEKKAVSSLENSRILEFETNQDKQFVLKMLKFSADRPIKDKGVEKLEQLEKKVASGGYYERHHGELSKDLSQITTGSTALFDNDAEK